MEEVRITQWVEKLLSNNAQLSHLLEELRESFLSDIPDERESGLTLVVAVVKQLPAHFLSKDEVGTLLEFLLKRLESSALAGSSVIEGINHLVLNSKELPDGIEQAVVKFVFMEGSVQSWPQKDRKLQYEIMQWLLKNRLSMVQAIGTIFIESFIKCIDGEKDPRCLLTVFDMFQKVCASFELFGALAEEMFETVACYYPVEFKPQPNDTITRDLLASSCARCLVASPAFAPYCYLMIDEKFNEEECTGEQRGDVCALLILACQKFSPTAINVQFDEILGGLRMAALDPKNKGAIPPEVLLALTHVIKTVQQLSPEHQANEARAVLNLLENLEPFILQAEMGLSEKAFLILRRVHEIATEPQAERILQQVIAWLTSLIQGESVNVAANKSDITKESVKILVNWLELAERNPKVSKNVLTLLEESLFASLDVSREIAPQESLVAMFLTSKTFIILDIAEEHRMDYVENLIENGLKSMVLKSEIAPYLSLVKTFAVKHKKRLFELLKRIPRELFNKEKIVPVFCASIIDEESFKIKRDDIKRILINEKEAGELDFESFVDLTSRSKADEHWLKEELDLFDEICVQTLQTNNEIYENKLSASLQKITLNLPENLHWRYMEVLAERFKASTMSRTILRRFMPSFLQCQASHLLSDVCKSTQNDDKIYHAILFAAVNKGAIDVEKLDKNENYWVNFIIVKALLLAGHQNATGMFEQLLTMVSADRIISEEQLDLVYSYFLNFEQPETSPELCNYVTKSPLWRQRLYFTLVPAYKRVIDDASEEQNARLIGLLSPLLDFAKKLGTETSRQHFSSLLPILLTSLAASETPSSSVLNATPAFLELADNLSPSETKIVVEKMCRVMCSSNLDAIITGLESLRHVAERQPSKSLHPLFGIVETACNSMLKHKKRIVRKLAADVKNSWEMAELK